MRAETAKHNCAQRKPKQLSSELDGFKLKHPLKKHVKLHSIKYGVCTCESEDKQEIEDDYDGDEKQEDEGKEIRKKRTGEEEEKEKAK